MTSILDMIREKFEEKIVMSRLGKTNVFLTVQDVCGNLTSFGFVNMVPVPYRLLIAYVMADAYEGRNNDVAESFEDLMLFWEKLGYVPSSDIIPTKMMNPVRNDWVEIFGKSTKDIEPKQFQRKFIEFIQELEYGLEMSLSNPVVVPVCF